MRRKMKKNKLLWSLCAILLLAGLFVTPLFTLKSIVVDSELYFIEKTKKKNKDNVNKEL